MGANRSNTRSSSPAPISPAVPSAPISPAVPSAPISPVLPPALPAGMTPIQRARQIAQASQTPIQQAQSTVGRNVAATSPIVSTPPCNGQPLGMGNPGAALWGLAKWRNNLDRNASAPHEPPLIHYMIHTELNGCHAQGTANPAFIASIPDPPRPPDPETPITQSIITQVVNEIIDESNEVVEEIKSKIEPFSHPVIIEQDVEIQPPVPITPTELVLEAQASCEKLQKIPEINIDINNENIVTVEAAETGPLIMSQIIIEAPVIHGCMDPDAINYNPSATVDDQDSCVYIPVEEIIEGCMDPEAKNYNPDATSDDGSCTYEPIIKPFIPEMTSFYDSHGQVIFQIPKSFVEAGSRVRLESGTSLDASLDLVNTIFDRNKNLEDSDLILTEEEKDTSIKKGLRDSVGGELANDKKLPTEEDIVLIKNDNPGGQTDYEKQMDLGMTKEEYLASLQAQTITELIRNNRGVIILSPTDNPNITIPLRSQAFSYKQYRSTIDTKFNHLIGKM